VGSLAAGQAAGAELSLEGTAYVLDYWDLDRFDLASLRVGPELQGGAGPWRWWMEASLGRVYLDYEAFEQIASLEGGLAVTNRSAGADDFPTATIGSAVTSLTMT